MHRKLLRLRTKKFLNKRLNNCSRSRTSKQMENEGNRTGQKKPFHKVFFPGMMVPFVAPYFLPWQSGAKLLQDQDFVVLFLTERQETSLTWPEMKIGELPTQFNDESVHAEKITCSKS